MELGTELPLAVYLAVAVTVGAGGLLLIMWLQARSTGVPKGSGGWPLIGETLDFANTNPMDFAVPRIKKFGSVFKSHLVGVPSIMITTSDMARWVYSEKGSFRASYPKTIAILVGKKFLTNCDPARHPFLKKIIQSALLPEPLRHHVARVEDYVLQCLNSWVGRTVQTTAEMKEFTLDVAFFFIFGLTDLRGSPEAAVLVETYRALSKGFYALPVYLPGFTWYKALKTKERGCKYLKKLIAKSRKDSEEGVSCNSVLRALVDAKEETGKKLDDSEIIDMLIGTLFGAHDTTATSLVWIVKFLTENPDVLKAVLAEQEEIRKSKEPGEPLSWEDTRNMHYTQQVIQETLRYPTILQYTARMAMEDLEYKGYRIPKGWRVFIMTTCIHLNPENYEKPQTFDPSRFKEAPKPGTFFPFGGGSHICPGNELAKMVILVFIHHLTTKFRWESLNPDMGTEFKPFPLPKGGFPIKVRRRTEA